MPCLHCGASKTIEAHLVPKSFVMDVKIDRGEQHLILHKGKERPQMSHTGIYDRSILCADCDNILGRYEDYAHRLLKNCRDFRLEAGKVATIKDLDGDTMVRFASGLAWKYAVTDKSHGRINIGSYPAILREVALAGAPIPDSVDVLMARIVELDGDVYYYRTPMPDRKAGVNVVRFCVGGFLFFLKIDKRRPDSSLPDQCLRGRSAGDFLAIPGEFVEEAQMHRELSGRPQVRKFFQTMRQRKAAQSS
jgi:hypothetical protein